MFVSVWTGTNQKPLRFGLTDLACSVVFVPASETALTKFFGFQVLTKGLGLNKDTTTKTQQQQSRKWNI